MKKTTILAICLAMLAVIVGCTKQEAGSGTGSSSNKELLRIRSFELSEQEAPGAVQPQIRQVDIPAEGLIETSEQPYRDDMGLDAFADHIKTEFGIGIDERWHVTVHFYDEERTQGFVRFKYTIGDILTNRSILFHIDSGKAVSVFTGCLDGDVDEEDLTNRIRLFEERYEQEKLRLKDGEELVGETAYYTYYYNLGLLQYTYNVFFRYGDGIINNDWGTECYIDENGAAFDAIVCYDKSDTDISGPVQQLPGHIPYGSFSYKETSGQIDMSSPGVLTDGFVNVSEEADFIPVERAKAEVTVPYDLIQTFYDSEEDVWMVHFWDSKTAGGDETVFLSGKGVTLLVIYGE